MASNISNGAATRYVPISIQRKASVQEIGDKLIGMLDEIEKRVEHLRETAAVMEQEREALMEMLNTVQVNKEMLRLGEGDRDDIEATTNRLLSRCRTVQVLVSTPRNTEQSKALDSVNQQIEELLQKIQDDLNISKQKCQYFLNACQPDQPLGPIDQKFQAAVIECTADDQKKVRRRLERLMSVIDRGEKTIGQAEI